MKYLTALTIVLLSFIHLGTAQSEIKLSPALIGGVFGLSYEQGINEDLGVELYGVLAPDFVGISIAGKYYLKPKLGLDRFHVGVFIAGASDVSIGIGFLVGTKIVSQKGFLFEIGGGVGRGFEDAVIPYLKLDFGYRFGRKKTSKGIE